MKSNDIPKDIKLKFSIDYIKKQKLWEAIQYFIFWQAMYDRELSYFNIDWLKSWGNIENFWLMVHKNSDPIYWKNIIDYMFVDDWFIENKSFWIKDIIYAGNQFNPHFHFPLFIWEPLKTPLHERDREFYKNCILPIIDKIEI